jgi:hypothetical protein
MNKEIDETDDLEELKLPLLLKKYKKQLFEFGLLLLILVVLFSLTAACTTLSRTAKVEGLRQAVQKVLSENGGLEAGDEEPINSPFAVSAASFTVSGTDDHAVIIRIPTIYGAFPAVFLWQETEKNAQFLSLATVNERINDSLIASSKFSQIAYWEKRIPKILKTGGAK